MGQRLIYQWDLLCEDRRASYEQAARRNGKKLSKWLREVVDAAAERAPLPAVPAEAEVEVDLSPAPGSRVLVHEHTPRSLPWGGRQCEGCGELL